MKRTPYLDGKRILKNINSKIRFEIYLFSVFRTLTKWNMGALESCERIKTDVLRLHFDTIKRDKKERIYKVEEGLGQVKSYYFFFVNE